MVLVIPQNDERKHVEDVYCWCEPTEEEADIVHAGRRFAGPIVIHHAADCREIVEQAVESTGAQHREPGKGWKVIPL